MTKFVIVDGAIGVGKSTIMNKLAEHLRHEGKSVKVIPEYIEKDWGPEALQDYLAGKVRAFDFQDRILNHYWTEVSVIKAVEPEYAIIERSPLAGVQVFAKNDLKNGKMTEWEYILLVQKASHIMDKINLGYFKRVWNVEGCLDKAIEKMVLTTKEYDNIHFFVCSELNDIVYRVHERARPGEEVYSKEYLATIAGRYELVLGDPDIKVE